MRLRAWQIAPAYLKARLTTMLNGRLYRAAFAPVLLAIVVAGFSLTDGPRPLTSTLAPDVFDGARATRDLQQLAAQYPSRRPGSAGDDGLARYVAQQLAAPPPPESGATGAARPQSTFTVGVRHFDAQTIDGVRTLSTVVARRPGITNRSIVVLAHRDAAARGSAADLSGTAALLELGRILSQRVTTRSVELVSTSGGSGGDAGAADFAANVAGPVDAVIVLGDIAGTRSRRPFVLPWSDDPAVAPLLLQRTAEDAIAGEVGTSAGDAGMATQFAHLALPFAPTEQGVLNAAGLPAVTVQVSGERGPSPSETPSANRLQNFGRAALRAFNALDAGADVPPPTRVLVFQGKLIPEWAVRLLVAVLLLPALLATVDGFARARRRREPVAMWLRWALACAAPFFVCALFMVALRTTGILPAAPGAPVGSGALEIGTREKIVLAAAALVLGLCWLAFRAAMHTIGVRGRPGSAGAGAALLLVLAGLAVVVWAVNPYAAALLVPAVHLWLVPADPELRPRRALALALVAVALIPVAAVIVLYARQLGMDPLQVLWTPLLLVAGGHIGIAGAALWSLALGCAVAAAQVAVRGRAPRPPEPDGPAITVRGPLTYAGPGSLGGTESALRR
jgi:hypothetical protein